MKPRAKEAREPGKQARSSIGRVDETSTETTPRDQAPAVRDQAGDATDAELERAIIDAVTAGAFDVARVLAARLEGRRRGGVVVPIRRG